MKENLYSSQQLFSVKIAIFADYVGIYALQLRHGICCEMLQYDMLPTNTCTHNSHNFYEPTFQLKCLLLLVYISMNLDLNIVTLYYATLQM